MKPKLILSLLIITTLYISACTYADIIEPDDGGEITRKVTYSGDIKNIMFNNCLTCHSGSIPAAQLDLTTYTNVKWAAKNQNLLKAVNNGKNPMPPARLLPQFQRKIIEKWINDGFPR